MFCAICRTKLTRRSRGIHAAWHFWYAVSFGGERGVLKVGLSGIHPLTQRYMHGKVQWKKESEKGK
ncbi:DUF3265 domain-containing protein [Vibrio vulnificus]|nr:DUF3265 domain-containing protein [Vibrio vulnificus]AUW39115.1 DUF3265 domain-containing protein [Vibrio vulnificus]ELV8679644.1 DUF3265 domain-containing protein [Vibrio vulnificus]MCU8330746.1 DUF3265 domain-containing protein [Vibrio vulnificus]MCU8378418.1 DUF3265 domain-containing protein [Vibrio vulnificus]HAS8470548.1 DUF3265 domain-containing protein [Vibrio vulnificus]